MIRRHMMRQFGEMLLSMGIATKADGSRLDAAETGFIAKQLEFVMAQTYDVEYGPNLAMRFIPIDTSVPEGAETFAYDQWDRIGLAKIIQAWGDDFPKAEAFVKRFIAPCKSLGLSYEYTMQDIRAIQFSRGRLNDERAIACRVGIDSGIDTLAAFGNSDHGLKGFLNHSAIPTITRTSTAWTSTLDPAVILADLKKLEGSIVSATRTLHKPDTVLFSTADWSILQRTIGANFDTTILQAYLKTSTYIKNADQWPLLDTAGSDSHSRVLMYERNPAVVSFVMPFGFRQYPPQQKNLAFHVPCEARVGGITMKYPLGAAYMDTRV